MIARVAAKMIRARLPAMNQKPTSMSDTIRLDKQALRLAEQATFDYRGTFIVEQTRTTVIPAWLVDRERRANGETNDESGNRGRHRAGHRRS